MCKGTNYLLYRGSQYYARIGQYYDYCPLPRHSYNAAGEHRYVGILPAIHLPFISCTYQMSMTCPAVLRFWVHYLWPCKILSLDSCQ